VSIIAAGGTAEVIGSRDNGRDWADDFCSLADKRMILSSYNSYLLDDRMIFEEEGEEGEKGAEKMDDSERTDTEAEGSSYSFLTKRQLEVLQMRHQGLSQQDIAERLGTTRSNISILEKRAHQNIARAQRTVRQWMMIRAPISLFVKGGTDVFEIPRMIFAAADEMGIRLHVTSMDILVQLRRNAPRLFHKRVLGRDVRIYVNENGEAMVEVAE
jgi:hypothetical protein